MRCKGRLGSRGGIRVNPGGGGGDGDGGLSGGGLGGGDDGGGGDLGGDVGGERHGARRRLRLGRAGLGALDRGLGRLGAVGAALALSAAASLDVCLVGDGQDGGIDFGRRGGDDVAGAGRHALAEARGDLT